MRRHAGMVSASWRTAGKINGRHAVILRGTGRTDWFVAIRRYLVAIGRRQSCLGNGAAAALHIVAHRHAGSIGRRRGSLHGWRYRDCHRSCWSWRSHCSARRPGRMKNSASVLMAALAGGIGYTIYSEYVNTGPRASWAYNELDADPALDRHRSFTTRAMDRGAITRISFCAARCIPLAIHLKSNKELRP